MGRHTETCELCKGTTKDKEGKPCAKCKGAGEYDVWTSGMGGKWAN